ncbi:MAG: substrate-binding domain-containing protein [Bacteroides sp.]|nr:substrate-binding domain-containing protein [Bacteroides sp.]MCM1412790.1 substrate-binding domain-containing protein [Bacteroides sp.]MCM1470916.1 substrate-binding domain-containing protein [Bacteroides sp.]
MNRYVKTYLMAAVAALALLTACGKTQTGDYHKGAAVVACDATFRNVLEQEVQVFEYKYPGSNVLDLYVDEDAAIDSLLNLKNNVRLAVTSRPLDKEEIKYLNDNKRSVNQAAIAVDAVALIVNPENPMESIDTQDLIDILTGKYTTWDKIPQAGDLGKIIVAFDHQGSSATRFMRDSLMNGGDFGKNVYAQGSPRAVIDLVASHKNAIGVVGVSWLASDLSGSEMTAEEMSRISDVDETAEMATFSDTAHDVKVLAVQGKDKVDAYLPTQYNIYSGDYPYYRQIYLISTSAPSTVGHSFYTFVTGSVGQKVILSTGICPKTISTQFVEL